VAIFLRSRIRDYALARADNPTRTRYSGPITARLPYRALGVTMLPSSRLSKAVEWTCPIGAVIGGRAQTVHSAQRGRAKGVRPPDGVDEP
jgi:hypothetical protein